MVDLHGILDEECARSERAQAIILATVVAAGGRWQRKTTLWKAFWWAHLEAMRDRGAELSDYPIVRLPQGPAPNDGDLLTTCLELRGLLAKSTDGNPKHPSDVFTVPDVSAAKQWIGTQLDAAQLAAVERAALKFKGMTARAASEFSHKYSAEWRAQSDGRTMNIYRDLVSEAEMAAAIIRSRETQDALTSAFGPSTQPARQ